jgi:2-polyprenyl-6-hydroxyphenyl methylase/3-demethylubiquinone-9 3-methyltransferase
VTNATAHEEIRAGKRFGFGRNWSDFLANFDDDRLREAETSLKEMLEVADLAGKRFLDIGCGSGLFSLAARRLGATVHSFDFDPDSVACAETLKSRYFANDSHWTIARGSALDADYVRSLGQFDVVYSWGVLHHTGAMWDALGNALLPLGGGGRLFIAIYNDQGVVSRFWWRVKKMYCSGPVGRAAVKTVFFPYFASRAAAKSLLMGQNEFVRYKRQRGMSITHDWVDWLGGFPFEVAKPEEIFDFYRKRGLVLQKVRTTNTLGNNEFVFSKPA